jgi:hypothetical protein
LIFSGPVALFLIAIAPPPEAKPERDQPAAQVMVRRQIVIRSISTGPRTGGLRKAVEWQERRGPRCVPAQAIAGAARMRRNSVDLILRNQRRVRVRLGRACPALDYYYGFYITPGEDGLVCSDRDSVRSRVGGQCEIDRFDLLRPVALRPVAKR